MNQPTPESAAASQSPTASRTDTRTNARVARLQNLVNDGPILAWTRGWVSREVPLHALLAARTLDFAVLTDHSLALVTTGFFSRRPRRCVYSAPLDAIFVSLESVPRGGRRLRIISSRGQAIWIELGTTPEETSFASALVARSRPIQP